MVRLKSTFSLLLLSFLTIPASPQAPAAPQDKATIKTNVEEVLLDIVVRDKKGKPVYDVTPGDVTVTDNGVKQHLTSFRLVQPSLTVRSRSFFRRSSSSTVASATTWL